MSKIIHIIAPYPQGEAPSQRFRYEQYLTYLQEDHWQIRYHSFHSNRSWRRLYQPGKFGLKSLDLAFNFLRRFALLFQLIPAKHIFMHREMTHIGPPIFEWILVKVLQKKYHYDFDDAIWIPNYSQANKAFQRTKCYWKIPKLIRWAASVSAGNDYLASYASQFNKRVQVIPTTIDTDNQHNQQVNPEKTPLVIGWTGTHSTMHYLMPIIPLIEKLEQEYPFEFHVISNQPPSFQLKSLRYKAWNLETEIDDLAQIQIGIMPLVRDQWSEGKCGFKALQYMSLGMASIVSPIGVNTKIIQHEHNGLIAESLEEWEHALRLLINNLEQRKHLGNEAVKSIQKHWSVRAWKETYLELFKR
jgi:glycosyltransferase involved in cell wall biosynthesis